MCIALVSVVSAISQVEVMFSSEMGPVGGTVDVDVTANGFENISVMQFSAGWDSLVMTFNSVVFTNPDLTDLIPSNISGSEGAANVDPGQFSFSYGNPTGDGTVPDGAVLFTVRFDLVGEMCDDTDIALTNDPTTIEAFDNNFNELTVTSQSGNVMIEGNDCNGNGGGDDDLQIIAPTTNVPAGGSVCLSLAVENFIGVQAGSGTILWDPTVISYTGIDNINITGVNGSLNETNTDNGELKFVWSNPDPVNPLSIPDGDAIFDICFDVVGNIGDMSTITLSETGSLGFEWYDDNNDLITQSLTNGKVTIVADTGDPVTISAENADGMPGENVCVDFTVENFTNIISTQYVISWDPSILGNAAPANFNLESLNGGNFNISNGQAVVSWSTNAGIDVADNTVIFQMCFDILGDCGDSSSIDLGSNGSTQVEIGDGSSNPIDNYLLNSGTLDVVCPEPCEIISIDQPCAGAFDGNVTVNAPTTGCTYSWTDSQGNEVSTDQNLLGVSAGTYFLTVTCGGEETCTLQADVVALDALSLVETITPAACGTTGAISVTVNNGSGNYSYNWNPSQPNSPSISGLDPGTYSLTVTDNDSGCTQSETYTVNSEADDISISNNVVTDESCNGNDGSIMLTVTGGCEPYTYSWSDSSIGNTPNAVNLTAGNYSVTVTDNSTPAKMATGSYTIEAAGMISLVGSPTISASNGNDGAISITVTGGIEPYNFSWSGPTTGLPNSNSITGLAPGDYNVTVTDANGCSQTFGPIPVPNDSGDLSVSDISVVGVNDEYDVLCNGDETATASATIETGTGPFTVNLTGAQTQSMTLNTKGTFTFSNLGAGDYTVTVSQSNGSSVTIMFTVFEPPLIVVDAEIGCDNGSCDGFIDLEVEGGVGEFTIEWGDPDLNGLSNDDLCEGTYPVTLTDELGCVVLENSFIVEPCSLNPPGCYLIRDVITPNGDGVNDRFRVTCVNDFPTELLVYDRWGQLVYNESNYDGRWEGVGNDGTDLIEGGYMYVLSIDFGPGRREIMKGTLTILRN